jgi:hypothetical protein
MTAGVQTRRAVRWLGLGAATTLVVLGPLSMAAVAGTGAGADSAAGTSLAGYNASALAVGAQFGFDVPNVVPLPNENLIEEDVPFSRTTVGSGPVADALGAPYYPGDIAADLGSLLITFGAPALPLNDPILAQSKFPTSPGYPAHATFGIAPSSSTTLHPSIFSSEATTSPLGGSASGTVADLALDELGVTKTLPLLGPSSAGSLLNVGNVSATNDVALTTGDITATATSEVKGVDIAGLVDIASLTSTATAVSDGTTGTPTASLHLGQVTVDGESAFIDGTGVHLSATSAAAATKAPITPAQLQQSLDATLAQDGISIRVLNPVLTTTGAQATADAGGLQIAIAHQFDVPFIPNEPTIPLPELGNVGLPAGLYTFTTTITLGLAQTSVAASALASEIAPLATTPPVEDIPGLTTFGSTNFGTGSGGIFGSTGTSNPTSSVQSLPATGPGSGQALPPPVPSAATDFPIHGIPPPIGWTIAALLACILAAYPLLLLARWQFVTGRRP